AIFQDEARENLAAMEGVLVGLEHSPEDPERLHTLFRMAHTLKGNADSLGLRPVAELAHALEDLLDRFRGRTLPVTREHIDLLLESVDALRDLLARSDGPSEAGAPPTLLSRLKTAAGGARGPIARRGAPVEEGESSPSSATPAKAEVRTQRVAVSKLDRLLDLATEIAIDRGRLRQALGGQATALLDGSEHVYAELHDLVMRSRLVPLRPMLDHFARVARDLGRSTGKPARLVVEERGVEVDIRLAEGLRDPLMHMLRNAF